MKEFLAHITGFTCFCMLFIIPLFTVFTVQIIKRYTNVTKEKSLRYLSWVISTIYWALYALPNGIIESYFFLNILVPGIMAGMVSNSYYDAFTCRF